MVDGRHIENRNIALSLQRLYWSPRMWRILRLRTLSEV